jgi:hypothetical protein
MAGALVLALLAVAIGTALVVHAVRRGRRRRALAARAARWRCRRPLACGDPSRCDCTQDTRDGPSYFERRAAELPRTIETHAPVEPVADIERSWRRADAKRELDEMAGEAWRSMAARGVEVLSRMRLGLPAEPVKVAPLQPKPSHRYGWQVVLVGETWYAVPDRIQGAPLGAVVVERYDAAQVAWLRENHEGVRAAAFEAAGVA